MGRFQKSVQDEAIVGPLRSGFRRDRWETEHANLGDDGVDEDLMRAGLLIFEKANNVRAALNVTFSKEFRATTKVRAFAAMANYNLCVLKSKTQQSLAELVEAKKNNGAPFDLLSNEMASITLELPVGEKYGPDEIVQAMVDGVQVPLKRILESGPNLSGNAEFGRICWEDVLLDFNLGGLYSHVESLWNDCLWNGYKAQQHNKQVQFQPQDPLWQVREAVSRVRYTNLGTEFAMHAVQAHKDLLYTGRLPSMGVVNVKALSRSGRRQEVQLTLDPQSAEVQWLVALRLYASEPYYTELLREPQASLEGASLDQLLIAWSVVSSLSDLMRQEVEKIGFGASSDPRAWLPSYAPVIQIAALAQAVFKAAACSFGQAKAIVKFLTYGGKADQELWGQPLLPVSNEAVVPLFATTNSPNLRRLVDVWLKQLGVDMGRRGPAFEAHIRSSLRDSIATSPLLSGSACCLNTHLKFTPPGEREEEIDVVAVVGDVLLLGEAKCFLEPAEAREIARHRDKVLDAVKQVERKASAVRRNKEAFRQRAVDAGLSLPNEFHVQPVVILNNAIHVGIPVEGVPVIDEHILSVFFRGEFIEFALKMPNQPIAPVKKRILYSSAEEASTALPEFLALPPQMEPLMNGIKRRWVPVLGVNEEDWQGAYLTVSCVPEIQCPAGEGEQTEATVDASFMSHLQPLSKCASS